MSTITALVNKYPDRIPVVVRGKNVELQKTKFMVPKSMTFSEFLAILKKYIKNFTKNDCIMALIDTNIPEMVATMEILYQKHKKDDMCLIVVVFKESTFG